MAAGELEVAVRAMREGLQIIDREWRYVYLNNAAVAHARKPLEELIGKTMMECYPGIDETPLFDLLRAAMYEDKASSMENVFRYSDGPTRIFELRIEPCRIGIIVLSIDVSTNRRLEEQLRHAQKMEAVGRLASGVAHDFNNILTIIMGYTALMLEDLDDANPLRDELVAVRLAGQRAADLTKQLLAFSRQQPAEPRLSDLNHLVRECDKMLRRLVGADIQLVMHLDRDVGQVLIDPGHFDQVLMNLVVNARDAMPDGGKLTIETHDVHLDDAYARDHLDVTPGRYAMLAVSDSGVGMDRATQAHIFEPFFTTKAQGKGTGLGLSTVFGIVKQAGGSIWVYSEPGTGTTFKVYLPHADRVIITPPRPAEPPDARGGNETVLLAEDDAGVRRVTTEILTRNGYRVLVADNGNAALDLCERYPGEIHLLLSDVIMPQVSGRELARRLTERRPNMKVLFMSGYTDNSVVQHAILDPGVAYIQKPIVPDTLLRQLRRVLGEANS